MTTTLGEELRALSETRELSFRQSAMTVFGTVPPLRDVQEAFSTSLARAVGIQFDTIFRSPPVSTPLAALPSGGGRAPLSDEADLDDLETYEGICGLPDDIDSPLPLCEEPTK